MPGRCSITELHLYAGSEDPSLALKSMLKSSTVEEKSTYNCQEGGGGGGGRGRAALPRSVARRTELVSIEVVPMLSVRTGCWVIS